MLLKTKSGKSDRNQCGNDEGELRKYVFIIIYIKAKKYRH
jgi:hypothetical protein